MRQRETYGGSVDPLDKSNVTLKMCVDILKAESWCKSPEAQPKP